MLFSLTEERCSCFSGETKGNYPHGIDFVNGADYFPLLSCVNSYIHVTVCMKCIFIHLWMSFCIARSVTGYGVNFKFFFFKFFDGFGLVRYSSLQGVNMYSF